LVFIPEQRNLKIRRKDGGVQINSLKINSKKQNPTQKVYVSKNKKVEELNKILAKLTPRALSYKEKKKVYKVYDIKAVREIYEKAVKEIEKRYKEAIEKIEKAYKNTGKNIDTSMEEIEKRIEGR
jgi:hypothetical protein